MMLNDTIAVDFQFDVDETCLNLGKLRTEFEHLPQDNYLAHEYVYRKRRYSAFKVDKSGIQRNSAPSFSQSTGINKYAGGIKRVYEPIQDEAASSLLDPLISLANQRLGFSHFELGIHLIRVVCTDERPGYPAPEGLHQDGFDYVLVIPVHQHNINGGTTIITDLEQRKVLLKKDLQAGEQILINDNVCKHYASPIISILPGAGYRDVLVATYKTNRIVTP